MADALPTPVIYLYLDRLGPGSAARSASSKKPWPVLTVVGAGAAAVSHLSVIPAKAGIQGERTRSCGGPGFGFRRNDGWSEGRGPS
jgi:hypothetical protein